MDSNSPAGLDAEAQALIESLSTPRRRARPRLAAALRQAEDFEVPTPTGPVAAWRLGEGPAVLMVHGWEDDNALWGPLIDTFVQYGRAVVVLDLPGHGYSEARLTGPQGVAASLCALADLAGPVTGAIAHSFGCLCLIAALQQGLRVDRAALIAPPLPPPGGRRLERRLLALDASPAQVRALEMVRRAPDAEPDLDALSIVPGLSVDALFLHDLEDEVCPSSNSAQLSAAWPGAALRCTTGLGHRDLVQDQDQIDALFAFIEGLGGSGDAWGRLA